MTAEWGSADRLVARADALAGAWGARARASTTIGQERAILRLFGVTGLDRAGRPLAGAAVDRWLAGEPRGLGTGIALPFAMSLVEYDLEPQQLALDVASGAIDLRLEAELLGEPDRRAVAEVAATRLADAAIERIDAQRTVRRETIDMLGEARRPWLGVTLREPDVDAALDEVDGPHRGGYRPDPGRGPDRARTGRPDDRCRSRGARAGQPRDRRRPACRQRAAGTCSDRQPASPRQAAPGGRSGGCRTAGVRPPGDLGAGARCARGCRRRRVRTDRPDRLRRDVRDRRRRRRAGSGAVRPRLRAPAGVASRHGHPGRARAAGRRARPVVRRSVGPGHACRPGPRPPAARRDAGAWRRPVADGHHRRRAAAVADRRGRHPAPGRSPRSRSGASSSRAIHSGSSSRRPRPSDRSCGRTSRQRRPRMPATSRSCCAPQDSGRTMRSAAVRAARAGVARFRRCRRGDPRGAPDGCRARPCPRDGRGRRRDARPAGRPGLADGRRRSAGRAVAVAAATPRPRRTESFDPFAATLGPRV